MLDVVLHKSVIITDFLSTVPWVPVPVPGTLAEG